MFSFLRLRLRKSQTRRPAAAIRQALASDGLPLGMDPAMLLVLEKSGSYSGRRVTYFRVFDPVRAREVAVQVRVFEDLDTHQELVLGSGDVEQNGAVAVVRSQAARPSVAPVRARADRADHGDDERFVFPARRLKR